MTIIINRPNQKYLPSWIKWILRRTQRNKNNLIAIVGKTGSGKSWAGLSVGEMIAKENGLYFGIDNIVFTLKELFHLINHGNLKSGSVIIFDEPQIEISSREFQSLANKVFNYLLTTFRYKNLTLIFATPYEDLLDKTARKLFHALWLTTSINKKDNTLKLKPVEVEYNGHYQKFYIKRLKVCSKPKGKTRYQTNKLKYWNIPKPSEKLIKEYELKKQNYTGLLYSEIEQQLEAWENKKKQDLNKDTRKELTEPQEQVLKLLSSGKTIKEISELLGTNIPNIYTHVRRAKNKGYKTNK